MIDLEQRYRRMMKMNLQKINYQKELEKLLTRLEKEEKVPTLLLLIPKTLKNSTKNGFASASSFEVSAHSFEKCNALSFISFH